MSKIDNLDISKLDFNTPLFGPVPSSKKADLCTTSSLPSTDYQNDESYKYTPPKRKVKDGDDDEVEENEKSDSDSGSGSGSGSNNSSGSDTESESGSGKSRHSDNNSVTEEKSGSNSENSSNEENEEEENDVKMENDSDHPVSMDTDSQDSNLESVRKPRGRPGRPRKRVMSEQDMKLETDRGDRSHLKEPEFWQEDPDLYGVRRSGRQKKEPTR